MTHEFGYCSVSATCQHCSSQETAWVPISGVQLYRHGALIQNAFPDQSPDQREIAMSSIKGSYYLCSPCWDKQFPED